MLAPFISFSFSLTRSRQDVLSRLGFSQILFFPSWFIMFIWQGYQNAGAQRAAAPHPSHPLWLCRGDRTKPTNQPAGYKCCAIAS
jgi:hypothetical protein